MEFIKLNLELVKELGCDKAILMCFLLFQPMANIKHQKWKQKTLAETLNLSTKTISRYLDDLQEGGWLKYERGTYGQLTTTNIELSDKALKYRISPEYKVKKNVEVKHTHHQNNISEDNFTTPKMEVKLTRAQEYLKYIGQEYNIKMPK